MKILELFVAKDGRYFDNPEDCSSYEAILPVGETPYIYQPLDSQTKKHNPYFDQQAPCVCGHPYYRHFDSYEDNEAVGCKYCSCYHFTLKKHSSSDCSCEHSSY